MKKEEASYATRSIEHYLQELSAGDRAPSGGSVAALVGALSSALIEMIANNTAEREAFASVSEEMKMVRTEVSLFREDLVSFIDEDAKNIQQVLDVLKLPQETEEQKSVRKSELEKAYYNAALVPLNVARKCLETFTFINVVLKRGNPNAASDAKVAAVLLRSAIYGSIYNVQTNIDKLADSSLVLEISSEIKDLMLRADELERRAIRHK